MTSVVERATEVMKSQIDAKISSYFSSCVNCGLCADACLFYTETKYPKYTPIYKLEPMRKVWRQEYTFWGKVSAKLGLSKPLKEQDLADWQELVYDSCTMCGRCSMVCPVGIDIVYMIRKEREAMSASGYAPEGLKGAAERALKTGSPMGVTFKTLEAQLRALEKESGLKIPVDVKGAEYMSMLSSLEIMGFPEYITSMAKIFKEAGISWTISSECFEATNSGIQIGDSAIAAELVGRIVSAAEKLEVKNVISPECGHAYSAIRWEGANLIKRALPFRVVHILELLDELREQGRIKTKGFTDDRLTYHDPCSITRKGGVVEQPRKLLNMVASNFVEMSEHGTMNWCCGGGGGVSANEPAEELRYKAFKRKKSQLEEIKVDKIVTACANCRNTIEDGLEHYDMENIEVIGVTELIAEHLLESK